MSGVGAKVKPIEHLDAWRAMVAESAKNQMVYVVDVFKDWCGPCTVMQFFFDQLVCNPFNISRHFEFCFMLAL
jgi:hypothetical protein